MGASTLHFNSLHAGVALDAVLLLQRAFAMPNLRAWPPPATSVTLSTLPPLARTRRARSRGRAASESRRDGRTRM